MLLAWGSHFILLASLARLLRAKYVDIDADQRKFIRDLDTSTELFSEKHWYLHSPDLFRKMKMEHAKVFMERLMSELEPADDADLDSVWRDRKQALRVFNNIRADDIETIGSSGVCRYLGYGMALQADSFVHAGEKCTTELLDLALRHPKLLKSFPIRPLTSHAHLVGRMNAQVFEMGKKSLKVLLWDASICKHIDARLVASLSDKGIIELISPRCFARLRGLSKTHFENMCDFGRDTLTKLKAPLTGVTIGAITKEQLAALDFPNSPCKYLELQHLSTTAAPGMSGWCLAVFYGTDGRSKGAPQLGELWKHFRSGTMERLLADGGEAVSEIHHHDYTNMPSGTLNAILANHRACGKINRNAQLPISSSTVIGKECFARLSSRLQPQVLAGLSSPPPDLLAQVDATMMSRWQYDRHGQTLQGFQVLRLVKRNLSRLIEQLSREASEHACKSIPNAATLLAEKTFMEHITDVCIEKLPFTLRAHECKKQPRMWMVQNFDKLVRGDATGQDEIIARLDEEDLAVLVGSKGFCRNLSKSFFKLLRSAAKRAIDPQCFAELKIKRYLTSADLDAMPESVITTLNADSMGDLEWGAIPLHSLRKVPAQPRSGSSAFSLLDEDAFGGWSPERLAALGSEQWRAIPPIAFASLTAEQLGHISTDVLQYWREEQVEELTDRAALGFSVEQIRKLGLRADPRAAAPLQRLELAEADDARGRAIRERLRDMPMSWTSRIMYGSGIAILLGTAGYAGYYYFFARKRSLLTAAVDI